MKTAICYDIVSDKRRNNLSKLLEGFGFRVQRSLFEMDLSAAELRSLLKKIKGIIDEEEDSVRIYRLPENVWKDAIWIGQRVELPDGDYFLI